MIARVEPLTRTRAVRGPFDYLLGDGRDVEVGSLLDVPFGRRREVGVVVALAERSELAPERLVAPHAILPGSIPADLVELAVWMAVEYCSTPARALTLMLPPGALNGAAHKQVLVAELTAVGDEALGDGTQLNARQRATLARLAEHGPVLVGELGRDHVARLQTRGLVAVRSRTQQRRPANQAVGSVSATALALTADQRASLREVLAALARRQPRRLLLHGVTGSGKTEVYLQAVAATLAAGRSAIVLVPEISLTPQAVSRFQARFGDVVAVLHSRLGRGERHDEWQRLRSGAARVCVGPRSAVFAPLRDLGLVVVDEEHDGSYKHEGDPRYDARGVAERRVQAHAAVLLAGSATPRPESAHAYPRLRLRTRVDGSSLPPVEVLDMRGAHHPLHPLTRQALADVGRAGHKAIVLLNRRGWSNFLSCRSCGHVWICPDCDVALVLHRAGGFVACHHCGHREPAPDRCVKCGSSSVARHGAGTERLEHELVEGLGAPGFPVLRLDADSQIRAASTLARFEAAPAGVLVGTQVVAKGHDFPDVTLGVVLDADQTLRFPDFRAEERTFSLVTQLAGRAGRGDGGGRVLVQTLAPAARSITFAAAHDADGFLADELKRRRALAYPPFSSVIRVVCSAEDPADALSVAAELKAEIAPPGAAVLGPAPLFRLRGRARSQLVIKATDRAAAIAIVGSAVDTMSRTSPTKGVNVSVDVDPR